MTDISHLTEQTALAQRRLDQHEGRLTRLEVHTAEEKVVRQNIERSLAEIQSGISWITRLVVGGLVAGAIAFIVSGGLNVGS